MKKEISSSLVIEIKDILNEERSSLSKPLNNRLLITYWKIGEVIIKYEQNNNIRADYGKQTIKQLSKELTSEFGRGFSRSNLHNMRQFYLIYRKC
ncbi:hypothetical protein J2S15_001070 [Breznakia pachnodae]|uniref:YhcG N-terminal domain-containing protein n=1 Tax=Breznakia pachnodae TaxID=265178 RepID=A0ABU0E0D3_9FIRM|nr:hypothetical protein [Breznakia pachnodae]